MFFIFQFVNSFKIKCIYLLMPITDIFVHNSNENIIHNMQ